jgi:2',3'-cyclic-nucleotide 2'-phosphodiesterase (5'-nucleotidase family)
MNIAGYDLFTPGNHDFNYGYEELLDLAKLADFTVLSANVKKGGQPIFAATTVKEIDGVKIGFFGLSTPETLYKTNPLNVAGLTFDDVVACARTAVADLQSQGVDLIVALSHLGTDDASEDTSIKVAKAVAGIDIIIDGHSHSRYDEGLLVGDTLIASAKEYENFIGCVTIGFDAANQVVEKQAALIGAEEAAGKYSPVKAVTDKIAALEAEQGKILDVVVAKLGYSLSSARDPGVRTQEMPLGNMAADALLDGTGAQIALTNGGGLRADLKEGDITVRDIIAVLPFGNYGVTKYVTPVQLKAILENGVDSAPAAVGKFPQIAGFTFTYNAGAPAGNRVTAISIGGTPVSLTDATTRFLMATNDFMAVGGDEYTTFASIPTENEFNALDEMLLRYIKANPDKVYAQAEGRITVAVVTLPAEVEEPPVTSAPPTAEPPAAEPPVTSAPPVAAPPLPPAGTGVVVNCYYLNVRAGHGPAYTAINYLKAGDRVTVLDSQYSWYLIDNGTIKGWVYSGYLQVS